MTKSGTLSKIMNKAAIWLKTEFPSKKTMDAVKEQGWSIEFNNCVAPLPRAGYVSVPLITSPEGKRVEHGTEDHKRYRQAIRDAVIAQQPKP